MLVILSIPLVCNIQKQTYAQWKHSGQKTVEIIFSYFRMLKGLGVFEEGKVGLIIINKPTLASSKIMKGQKW